MKAIGGSATALIPHVGWMEHEPQEEVISLLRQGHFEAAEQSFFWRFLKPGDAFLDCGAHIGLYTVLAWRAMREQPQALVAVEASSNTANLLRINIQKNNVKAEIVQSAVWSDAGGVLFDTSTLGRAAYARISKSGKTRVASVTLDDVVASQFPGPVTLLKLDIEGAEPEAVLGATKAIKKGLLPVVMIELTENNLARVGKSTGDLVEQLASLGYQVCAYDPIANKVGPMDRSAKIWHVNAIACTDVDDVNRRLAAVDSEAELIAQDILGRAAACSKFKELEEFDRLKALAEESESRRIWAEETEHHLAVWRSRAEGYKSWAQQTEEELEAARERAAGFKDWAKRSDATLAETKTLLEETRKWAMASDEALGKQSAHAVEMEKWARNSDAALAQRTAELEDVQAWARNSDAALVQRTAELQEALAWARKSDALLTERNALIEELKAWAEGAEARVSEGKAELSALQTRHSELEAALVALETARAELERRASELTAALAASEVELDRVSWSRRWKRLMKALKAPR